jgi:hypothetical protein
VEGIQGSLVILIDTMFVLVCQVLVEKVVESGRLYGLEDLSKVLAFARGDRGKILSSVIGLRRRSSKADSEKRQDKEEREDTS